jgi:hypothetical protein
MRTHISKVASIPLLYVSLRTLALPLPLCLLALPAHLLLLLHPQQRTRCGRFGGCSFGRRLIALIVLQRRDIQVLVVQLPMKLQLGLTLKPALS